MIWCDCGHCIRRRSWTWFWLLLILIYIAQAVCEVVIAKNYLWGILGLIGWPTLTYVRFKTRKLPEKETCKTTLAIEMLKGDSR